MDYKPYIQKAYRQIVHDVLKTIADQDNAENCALYISFQTNREDVKLPDFVRARYPEEITIVLENQFDDLVVNEKDFSVRLSFGGVSAVVEVPFNALTQFADVPGQFGLTLEPEKETREAEVLKMPTSPAKILSLDEIRAAQKK